MAHDAQPGTSTQPPASSGAWGRLTVEPMRPADVPAVESIERAVYAFPWSAGNFIDSLKAGYDAWLFRDDRHALMGYAVVMWMPDEVHLLNLSVAAACQRQGWGARMLHWLSDDCVSRGATAMMLEVRPSNVPARRLYDRFGFRQIGVRRRYYPAPGHTREDALVLRLKLADG